MFRSNEVSQFGDEDLAAECARRPVNEEAWREFWRRFYPLVHRTVLGLLKPFQDKAVYSQTDDILQLAFLRIFQNLSKFDRRKSPLPAYLKMMASHAVIDQLRRGKGKETVPLEGLDELKASVRGGTIPIEVLWQKVLTQVSELEPRKRAIIEEFFKGQETGVICSRHKIKPSYLSTIIYRFKHEIKKSLLGES